MTSSPKAVDLRLHQGILQSVGQPRRTGREVDHLMTTRPSQLPYIALRARAGLTRSSQPAKRGRRRSEQCSLVQYGHVIFARALSLFLLTLMGCSLNTFGVTTSTSGASDGTSGSTGDVISGSTSGTGSGSSPTGSSSTGMPGGESSSNTGSTGEQVNCPDFNTEPECLAADCMAITARPFFSDGANWCLKPMIFLACETQAACDATVTTACLGQAKYQFENGCLAQDFVLCTAPPDPAMDGYPECV